MGAVVAVAIAICGPCYCCRYDPENVLIQRNIDRERASVISDRVPLEYTHYVHVCLRLLCMPMILIRMKIIIDVCTAFVPDKNCRCTKCEREKKQQQQHSLDIWYLAVFARHASDIARREKRAYASHQTHTHTHREQDKLFMKHFHKLNSTT